MQEKHFMVDATVTKHGFVFLCGISRGGFRLQQYKYEEWDEPWGLYEIHTIKKLQSKAYK